MTTSKATKFHIVEAIQDFRPHFEAFTKATEGVCKVFGGGDNGPIEECQNCPFYVDAIGGIFCAALMARCVINDAIKNKLAELYENETEETEQVETEEKTEEGA